MTRQQTTPHTMNKNTHHTCTAEDIKNGLYATDMVGSDEQGMPLDNSIHRYFNTLERLVQRRSAADAQAHIHFKNHHVMTLVRKLANRLGPGGLAEMRRACMMIESDEQRLDDHASGAYSK